MKQYFVLSILAENSPGLLQKIAKLISQMNCSIETSRMTLLGSEVSMAILITGTWDAIAKLEANLEPFAKKNEFKYLTHRSKAFKHAEPTLAYTIELVCKENQGIISAITDFLVQQNIDIYEVFSNTYVSQTGTQMSSLVMRIYICAQSSISDLRERFMLLCEDLNVDAILEPDRS